MDARTTPKPGRAGLRRRLLPASLMSLLGLAAFGGEAFAGTASIGATTSPTGGVVVGGTGSIVQQGASTIVNQQSKLLSLNWKTFNVGKDASVLFNQPSFTAVALNRILDQNPSQIFGHISSNGQVFLINTHGIIFGSSAKLNVGGLVASTLDLTPTDFLSNHFNLDAHGGHAGIVNHGTIEAASGGSVSLVGGSVVNDGLIVANLGSINLDGADKAVLDFDGDGLISVQVTGALQQRLAGDEAAVANKGTLQAEGGTVVLQASAAKDLFTDLVNNAGVIDARGISTDGGVVRLVGSGGDVVDSGSINVSGVDGGSVQLLSDQDVGVTGGGIDADATANGDGGSITVKAGQAADISGDLSARGGAAGGDGGSIETSGTQVHIADDTRIDTLAPFGQAGTWLIDPEDFNIGGSDSDMSGATLTSNLETSNVVIESSMGTHSSDGTGSINVYDAVSWSGTSTTSRTLTLTAANDINIDAVMTVGDYGGLVLNPATANGTGTSAESAVATGTVNVGLDQDGFYGRVDFSGTGNSLSIDGTSYTIITSLGSAGSTTGTDLQGINGDLDGHYVLGADIDASATSGWNAGEGFTPIGDGTTNFTGVFDGLGHTITGLTVASTTALELGLFGVTDGTVSNVGLVGGSVSSANANVDQMGALAGKNSGTIFNAYATTLVSASAASNFADIGGLVGLNDGGSVQWAYATGSVSGGFYTGGLIGSNQDDAVVSNAFATGGVSAGGNVAPNGKIGGLVGDNNSGTITNAYATGAVSAPSGWHAGGLVGSNNDTITDAYALGFVSPGSNAGGLVGQDDGASGTVTNGYWDTETSGQATSSGGTGKTTAQLQSGLPDGFSSDAWDIVAGMAFPYLSTQFAPGAGTPVVVAGTVYTDAGTTAADAGVTVTGMSGGADIVSTQTFANGYYYELLSPGTLTDDSLLVYAKDYGSGANINGASFTDDSSSLSGLDIFGSTFDIQTSQTNWSAVMDDLAGAEGGTASKSSALSDLPVSGLSTLLVVAAGAMGFDNALNWTGDLDVSTGGAITQSVSVGMTVTGTSDFSAGDNAIDLSSSDNGFGGAVSLSNSGANPVALSNGGKLTLGNVAVGSGTLQLSGKGIVQSGSASITQAANSGTVTLDAGSGELWLTNTGNDFTGTVTASGTGIGLYDKDLLTIAAITDVGNGDVTLGAGGNLTLLDAANGGSDTFDSGSGTLTLQAGNLLSITGSLTLSGGNVKLTGTSGISLAVDVISGGTLGLYSSTGDITQTAGLLSVSGITTVNAGTGTISLQEQGNSFDDAVNLSGNNATISGTNALTLGTLDLAGALMATSTGTLNLGSGSVGGTLAATSGNGTISQTGALQVTGTSTIDAGTGNIDLSDTGNDFGGAVSLTGNNATIGGTNVLTLGTLDLSGALSATSTGTLDLGSGRVGGALAATSGGAISQDGALQVTGTSTIDAGTGDIDLSNAYNDFGGAVSLTGGNATIVDTNALALGTLDLAGALTATSAGPLNLGSGRVGGTLAASSDSGGIGQTGALQVTGASTVDAGTDDIVLSNTGNDFGGAVSLTGGNATIDGTNALKLGTLDLAGALAATSTGTLDLGTGRVGGTLAATSGGAISQDGALQVTGTSTIDAGTGDIDLSDTGNVFGGVVNLSGGNATIVDNGALTLGTLGLSGALAATSTGKLDLGTGRVGGTLAATSGSGGIGQAGALQVTGASTIDAGTDDIVLSNAGNVFGGAVSLTGDNATIVDTNALTLGTLDLAGALTATSTGTLDLGSGRVGGTLAATSGSGGIGQDGALQVTGASTIDAGTGDIDLSDTGNVFGGVVNLSGGNATIVDNGALTLGTLDLSGALAATSTGKLDLGTGSVGGTLAATSGSGGIGQDGALQVTGASTVDAGTDDIVLSNTGNDFGGAVNLTGGNATIVDKNALTLGTLDLAGALTVTSTGTLDLGAGSVGGALAATSGGAISQDGALQVTGTSTINAGTGDIDLSNIGNVFGDVVNLSGNNATIVDKDALTLGTVDLSGALAATGRRIGQSQSGVLMVDGTSTFNAGTGDIALSNDYNDFGGAVSLTGGNATIVDANVLTLGTLDLAGALTATSAGPLNLGSGSVGGTLAASSDSGGIGQTGALQVTGTSTVDAGTDDIDLSDTGNDFGGAVSLTGNNATIDGTNVLTLGTLNLSGALTATSTGTLDLGSGRVGGTLAATSGGAISQGGALQVTGTSTIDAGTGDIDLSNAGNVFGGVVNLSGGNATIVDNGALTLGTLDLSGALAATSTGKLDLGSGSVGGTLAATSGSGGIGQDGALQVTGASTVDAGTGDIVLSNTGNDFGGAVSLSGGNATIVDKNALTLGTLDLAGALSATSTGTLDLGSGSVGGALAATSGGAISQDGALQVTGISTIDAGTGDIDLSNAGNVFGGVVNLSGGNATIVDNGALTLGTLDLAGALAATSTGKLDLGSGSVGGTLAATSGNGIGQTGALQVTGASTIDAGTGDIVLSNTGNDFGGAVSLAGDNATIVDANALALGTLDLAGALTVTSTGTLDLGSGSVGGTLAATSNNGAISQSGALQVTGASTIDAGSASIVLDDAGNDFIGAVSATGGGVSLRDGNDLTLASLDDRDDGDVSLVVGNTLVLPAGGLDIGSGKLVLASLGGTLDVADPLAGSNVSLTGRDGITLGSTVTATDTLTLDSSAGAVDESGSGSITAATLAGDVAGAVTLGGANHVATLAGFSAGSLVLANARSLTVAGTVDGGSSATLTTTSGNLAIDGTLEATAVKLVSAGTIGQGADGGIVATTLGGQSAGAATLDGSGNQVAQLGAFSAAGFSLVDGRSLDVTGAVDGGSSTLLRTTSGDLALDAAVSGTTTTLVAAGAISEGSGGSVAATTLGGSSGGSTTLDGANRIGTLGDFSADGFSLANAQALTVAGTLDGGSRAALATTSGDLVLDGTVQASAVSLVSAGDISEGSDGAIVAGTLGGRSTGSTMLDPANMIDQLGDFSADGFVLENGKTLTVTGTVDGGDSLLLQTTAGGLAIDGTLDATRVTLQSADTITGSASGNIVAHTLTGSAQGATSLGTAAQAMNNHVDILGGFDSRAGFSFTNAQTLTLASVDGSSYTVNAGHADLYLGVTGGDLLESGTTWLYDGKGTWSSTGHIGLASAPIYVVGVTNQSVAAIGLPPAYFYALDTQGNLLPLLGEPSVNVPTSILTSRSQNANGHGDAYIDASVITANYRSFGIVPSGILLPPDQQDCQPGQPPSPECPDNE